MYQETTIAAIATAPGEGGIGIVRLSGAESCAIADQIFHTKNCLHGKTPCRTICILGMW